MSDQAPAPDDLSASLAKRWPLPGSVGLRDDLLRAWGDDGRGHHDLSHLDDVLSALSELHTYCTPLPQTAWACVLLAAWFHDAVYDAAPDAEERSAAWARSSLTPEAPDVDVDEVVRLVRLTATHDPEADDTSGQMLCDADLSILAAASPRYARYAAGVRHEYAAVPRAAYAQGRSAILRGFVARERIFSTTAGIRLWEAAARTNLAREIRDLESA